MISIQWIGPPLSVNEEGLEVVSSSSLPDLLAHKTPMNADAIVLNLGTFMPTDLDSIRSLVAVMPPVPIIVLADTADIPLIIQAIQAGAGDYLIKQNLKKGDLTESIRRAVERSRIQGDWKNVVHQAFQEASHDPLTCLPNRFLFQDRVSQALNDAKRRLETISLLFLDLDHFKNINDQFGHDLGDKCLVAVAQRLKEAIREGDSVCRYGGDEFIVMLRHLKGPEEAVMIGGRLLEILKRPLSIQGYRFEISASIGISSFPEHGEKVEELIKRADQALLRSKSEGKKMQVSSMPPPPTSQMSQKSVPSASRRPKILIVDDEEDLQAVLQKRLSRAGFDCRGCTTVEEAFQALQFNPDLVILDLGFRSASGIAFLQNMAQHLSPGAQKPLVMVLSAYGDPEIINYTKSLGVTTFLTKPFDSIHLVETVHHILH